MLQKVSHKVLRHLAADQINLLAVFLFPLILFVMMEANYFSWKSGMEPVTLLEHIQSWMSIVWLIPLPVALVSLAGMILYTSNIQLRDTYVPNVRGSVLFFRLVTRGINQDTVIHTAKHTIDTVRAYEAKYGVRVPFVMEIVTERTNPRLVSRLENTPYRDQVQVIEVPPNYVTENDARYKARALHYAIKQSKARPNDWIFHLDDESQIDHSTITGIQYFVTREEHRIHKNPAYRPKIGQGTILYHRDLDTSTVYTLADSVRTADDMGRFFLQYVMHACVFGMHGSFILCRNSVEQAEGFDFNPDLCITEDAYWGLRLMQKGYRFGHVQGYVHEQSPETSLDFIKQRRRWFRGIVNVLHSKDISIRYKAALGVMTTLWGLTGVVVIFTAINILHPVQVPLLIALLAGMTYSIYILMYILGYYLNITHANIPLYRKVLYLIPQIGLIPVFAILESIGAIYGLLDRRIDFYVIRKQVSQQLKTST